jgi:predicted Zn-dependent protease
MKYHLLLMVFLVSCSTAKTQQTVAHHDVDQPKIIYKTTDNVSLINEITKKIQLINQFVAAQKYDQAIGEVRLLIKKHPKNYVFYDMEGSVLFLKGNQEMAFKSFERSLELNPKNKEAKQMMEKTRNQNM